MSEQIPPTLEALKEALGLSAGILADIELSRVPLTSAALKASRLARLLNDFDAQEIFRHEAGGYPTTPTGVSTKIWRLAELAEGPFNRRIYNLEKSKPLLT